MKTRLILSVLFLVSIFGVEVAGGQAPAEETIPDWPAPATWSPARAHGALTTMGQVTDPLPFIGVSPCRILDTRGNGAPIQGGIFTGGSDVRSYFLYSICGIPASARAVSLNFTVTGPGQTTPGFLTAWPTGGAVPSVSILNWDRPQQQIANAAVVPTNNNISITVNVSAPTHVIMDINGYYAGAGTGSSNTFLGLNAGNFTMTGDFNTAFGSIALFRNTSGHQNSALGYGTLAFNDTGYSNTAVGYDALVFNTGGFQNIAIGHDALAKNTTGIGNTAVGFQALSNNITGYGNLALGYGAGSNITTNTEAYNILISNPGVAGDSGAIRIGGSGQGGPTFIKGIYLTNVAGVDVLVNSSGQLGITVSSRRFKEEVRDIADESNGLMRLRPVAFKYRPELDPAGLAQYGLIAEEVAEVYPDLVAADRDGRPEAVRYHLINTLLLNEVQKQHRIIERLGARLTELERRLTAESGP